MIDALGTPQSLLLLGGTSDIGVAIAERYLAARPLRVVLAARPSERRDAVAARLTARGATVEVVDFEALDTAGHQKVVEQAAGRRRHRPRGGRLRPARRPAAARRPTRAPRRTWPG